MKQASGGPAGHCACGPVLKPAFSEALGSLAIVNWALLILLFEDGSMVSA